MMSVMVVMSGMSGMSGMCLGFRGVWYAGEVGYVWGMLGSGMLERSGMFAML